MRVWTVLPFVVAFVAPTAAQADLGGGTPGIEIRIPIDPEEDAGSRSEGDYVIPDPTAQLRYLNLARCSCDAGGDDQLLYVLFDWMTQPTMTPSGQLDVYTGTACETFDVAERPNHCTELEPITDAADLAQTVKRFINLKDVMSPAATTPGCDPDISESAINLYMSTTGTLMTAASAPVMPIDMRAPAVPTTVRAEAQEGQITLSWDRISSGVADYEYFQALCAHATGELAHVDPTGPARFDTTASVCGAPIEEIPALTLENADEVVGSGVSFGELPTALTQLDEAYVCGEASGTAEEITLSGLQNGVPYVVVLVATDKAGNPTAAFLPRTVSPQPVTDFWEDVNEDNPDLEGGLCLVEATFGGGGGAAGGLIGALRAWRDELMTSAAGRWMVARYYDWGAPLARAAGESVIARIVLAIVLAPLVVIALAWHLLGLPLLLALVAGALWWRRRRARVALAAAALLATPALAAAQSMQPYWDDAGVAAEAEPAGPKWHLGLRIGPFLPGIDDERLDSRPYERMYGSGTWMPSLDLHRLWGTRVGQLGVGLSAGYFGKSANSWRPGSDTERAENNPSKLRIVPIELTAIYRVSQLDDHWNIPFVPYLRGGLAYSLWWVRRPDGELSKSCEVEGEQCDRGIGASLGLVGAAGLAIRAERIDADAARSMRDSGIEHAGFYAEVSTSWVDGFGNDKKLSLGDTTWSAGVDFEF